MPFIQSVLQVGQNCFNSSTFKAVLIQILVFMVTRGNIEQCAEGDKLSYTGFVKSQVEFSRHH